MGWAKYLEDNISIYNNNMYMRNNSEVCHKKVQKKAAFAVVKKEPKIKCENVNVLRNGRRGLSLYFKNEVDLHSLRKLQMNGWWWSRIDCCWHNTNSQVNRNFANLILIELNGIMSLF